MDAPHAPWTLTGECVVAVARRRGETGELPAGIEPLPGPALVIAVSYADSPVGPYVELAVGRPARLGLRPGLCITTMVVTSTDSRLAGRVNWGFPKEVGRLRWVVDGDERMLTWDDRGIVVRGVARRLVVPAGIPLRSVQRRADGPVVVPARVRGRVHLAGVAVDVPDDDPLAGVAGHHHGVLVTGMRMTVAPARHPVGVASSFRAPLRPPEPALSSSDGR